MTHGVDPLSTLRPLREADIEQSAAQPAPPEAGPLAYDVYRTGIDLVIEFDAPGVAPSDIALTVAGRAIEVTLRRALQRGPGVDVIEAGRQHGTFRQRLWLGDRWDLNALHATAEHGVLIVRAPLMPEVAHRTVQVASGVTAVDEPLAGVADRWNESSDVVDHDVDGQRVAGHSDAGDRSIGTAATHSAA